MIQLASVGDFCPNPECEDYGDVEAKAIIRYGKTRDGRQRYQCKSCKKTFNERKGTMFYNRKTEEKLPALEHDIRALAEPQSQQDPKFQSPFQYTRITAKAMRQALSIRRAGSPRNCLVKKPSAISSIAWAFVYVASKKPNRSRRFARPMPFSKTCTGRIRLPMNVKIRYGSRSIRRIKSRLETSLAVVNHAEQKRPRPTITTWNTKRNWCPSAFSTCWEIC